ncbi:MAG: hypothetical protein COA94_07555 [Rickettsiales bacterium]|nr:MAG: hypothetical protein COA94_07555 [Rickettsiales bacterium]
MNTHQPEAIAIIDSMENNMYHKLRYIPSKINSMSVTKIGETLIVDSALPSDTFNTAYGGHITLEQTKLVMEYYLNRKMPMAWWICSSSDDNKNTKDDMESAGFVHDEFDVGMYCDLSSADLDEYTAPEDLQIIECRSAQEFLDFGNVLSSIFDPTDEYVKIFYSKIQAIPQDAREDLILFVGYANNQPVATSGLFITDVAGIYDVSTKPNEQRKGYGSAMFHTALAYAKNKGLKTSILQASPDGLNIYKRFGYKEICDFNTWSNKAKLELQEEKSFSKLADERIATTKKWVSHEDAWK